MSETVKVTLQDLHVLAATAERNGTQHNFPAVALQWADGAQAEIESLRAALKWYADGEHFDRCNQSAWDTVSGEPQNWWCDEAGAGMVEDGTLAAKVLAGEMNGAQLHALED